MASVDQLPTGRWRARYRTPEGRSRSRTFPRKQDAKQYLVEQEHKKASGTYVDRSAGRVTFASYAEAWRAVRVHQSPR